MTNSFKIGLAISCGLVPNGEINGEPQFKGSEENFNFYKQELAFAEQLSEEAEEAKDQSYGEAIGSR